MLIDMAATFAILFVVIVVAAAAAAAGYLSNLKIAMASALMLLLQLQIANCYYCMPPFCNSRTYNLQAF